MADADLEVKEGLTAPVGEAEGVDAPAAELTGDEKAEQDLWNEVQAERDTLKDADPAPEGSAVVDEPKPVVKTEADPKPDPKGPKADPMDFLKPEEKAQFDALAAMATTPEQKAALEKVKHELASQRGRVSALTKKANTPPERVVMPVVRESKPIAERLAADPKWAKFKTEFGDVAEAVEGALGVVVAPAEADLQRMSQKELDAHYERQEAKVLEAHPDFDAVVASKEWKPWVDRLKIEAPAIHAAVMRQANGISHGPEAIFFVDKFKLDHGIVTQPTPSPTPEPAPTTKASTRRKVQAASSVVPIGVKTGPVTAELPANGLSDDQYWEAETKRREALRAGARR